MNAFETLAFLALFIREIIPKLFRRFCRYCGHNGLLARISKRLDRCNVAHREPRIVRPDDRPRGDDGEEICGAVSVEGHVCVLRPLHTDRPHTRWLAVLGLTSNKATDVDRIEWDDDGHITHRPDSAPPASW